MSAEPITTASMDVAVIRVADSWQIAHSGRRWGRFRFKVDAEEAAIRLAGSLIARGSACRVFVQEIAGELIAIVI